jgi:glycosyl hydrolase family 12
VHAFPNALLNDTQLPIQVSDINSLAIDVSWNYAVGDLATTTTDDNGLDAAKLNANVALDMFLSNDQTKAANSTLAEHEVMVWLGKYGSSTDPLGLKKGALLTAEIDQVTL